MRNQQSGFTLIELVMVIVILGILAATALPKFVDLQSDAAVAAADGVYGAATSAAAIQYAKRLTTSSAAYDIANATALLSAMDPKPAECTATNATTVTCTFNGTAYTMTVGASSATAPASITKGW